MHTVGFLINPLITGRIKSSCFLTRQKRISYSFQFLCLHLQIFFDFKQVIVGTKKWVKCTLRPVAMITTIINCCTRQWDIWNFPILQQNDYSVPSVSELPTVFKSVKKLFKPNKSSVSIFSLGMEE